MAAPISFQSHPRVRFDNAEKDLEVPFIVRKFIEGKSLRDWAVGDSSIGRDSGREFAGLAYPKWCAVAHSVLDSLEKLHIERIAHGFICPDSIIINSKGEGAPGNEEPSGGGEPEIKASFINAAEYAPSVVFQKLEEQPQLIRRWYDAPEILYSRTRATGKVASRTEYALSQGSHYPSGCDIYSLGVTLFYLATGSEGDVRPFEHLRELPGATARGWQQIDEFCMRTRTHAMKASILRSVVKATERRLGAENRGRIHSYLADCVRQTEVILYCVRSRVDRRARTVRNVRNLLTQFAGTHRDRLDPAGDEVLVKFGELRNLVANHQSPLSAIVKQRLDNLADEITHFSRPPQPFVRLTGGRGSLVDSMLAFLGSIQQKKVLVALTTPAIWAEENFGPSSRIASMIQLMRLGGISVNWTIALPREQLNDRNVRRLLAFRRLDDEYCRRVSEMRANDDPTQTALQPCYHYLPLNRDDYEVLLREKHSFIGASDQENRQRLAVLVAPDFATSGGLLVSLTYWLNPKRGGDLLKVLEGHTPHCHLVMDLDRHF